MDVKIEVRKSRNSDLRFAWYHFYKTYYQLFVAGILLICIIKALQFLSYSKKLVEQSEIIISGQDIYGQPGPPWFNGFRAVEKISIPFSKIDKRRTGILKLSFWSGTPIWSTDGQNILLSPDFEKDQLREIAELVGCSFE